MACCGGGGGSKRSVRKQVIERSEKTKQTVVQRVRRSAAPTGGQKQIIMARQHVVPHQKCQKCGFPTMSVNIAGRERLQCSNPDCRIVVK